eukprot:m.86853 g.86853  ORF g.86853 m.86853 type:complete len:776 (+) comp13074_c0_seq2:106-2433(+)
MSQANQEESVVLCEGTFIKRGISFVHNWKQRHFKIIASPKGGILIYYSDDVEEEVKGALRLPSLCASRENPEYSMSEAEAAAPPEGKGNVWPKNAMKGSLPAEYKGSIHGKLTDENILEKKAPGLSRKATSRKSKRSPTPNGGGAEVDDNSADLTFVARSPHELSIIVNVCNASNLGAAYHLVAHRILEVIKMITIRPPEQTSIEVSGKEGYNSCINHKYVYNKEYNGRSQYKWKHATEADKFMIVYHTWENTPPRYEITKDKHKRVCHAINLHTPKDPRHVRGIWYVYEESLKAFAGDMGCKVVSTDGTLSVNVNEALKILGTVLEDKGAVEVLCGLHDQAVATPINLAEIINQLTNRLTWRNPYTHEILLPAILPLLDSVCKLEIPKATTELVPTCTALVWLLHNIISGGEKISSATLEGYMRNHGVLEQWPPADVNENVTSASVLVSCTSVPALSGWYTAFTMHDDHLAYMKPSRKSEELYLFYDNVSEAWQISAQLGVINTKIGAYNHDSSYRAEAIAMPWNIRYEGADGAATTREEFSFSISSMPGEFMHEIPAIVDLLVAFAANSDLASALLSQEKELTAILKRTALHLQTARSHKMVPVSILKLAATLGAGLKKSGKVLSDAHFQFLEASLDAFVALAENDSIDAQQQAKDILPCLGVLRAANPEAGAKIDKIQKYVESEASSEDKESEKAPEKTSEKEEDTNEKKLPDDSDLIDYLTELSLLEACGPILAKNDVVSMEDLQDFNADELVAMGLSWGHAKKLQKKLVC